MNRKKLNVFVAIVLPALMILVGSFGFLKIKKEIHDSDNLIINNTKEEKKNLKSFFENPRDYETAFENVRDSKKIQVVAGIISHHFLAKDLIARFYSGISNDVDNVILVGPDHYDSLDLKKIDIAATKLSWDTPYGDLETNNDLMQNILDENSSIKIDDGIFKMEHSIYTEVPFIKKVFPQSKIIPLIVKNTGNYDEFEKIGESLRKISKGKTLMIISSDFSHESLVDDARKQDEQSITALENLKADNLGEITCDCRSCMAVMLGFLGNNKEFYFVENKNSADFGSPDKTVTSYVSGYFLAN